MIAKHSEELAILLRPKTTQQSLRDLTVQAFWKLEGEVRLQILVFMEWVVAPTKLARRAMHWGKLEWAYGSLVPDLDKHLQCWLVATSDDDNQETLLPEAPLVLPANLILVVFVQFWLQRRILVVVQALSHCIPGSSECWTAASRMAWFEILG